MKEINDLNATSGNLSWFDVLNGSAWTSDFMDFIYDVVALVNPSFFSKWFRHPHFHLPFAIIFICYMVPFGPPCHLTLLVRIGLFGASTVQVLLAKHFQFWRDTVVWNIAFIVINIIHIASLNYQLLPLKFSEKLEQLYANIFCPLNVSREQFSEVISCIRDIQSFERFEKFDDEKLTSVDTLLLVLSGKLLISTNGYIWHILFPHRIFDCQAWFHISSHRFFQVSITAVEESKVLILDRNKLRSTIISNNFLHSVFNQILGQGFVKILLEESKTMPMELYRNLPSQFNDREFEISIDMDNEEELQDVIQDIGFILKREIQDYIRSQKLDSISIH